MCKACILKRSPARGTLCADSGALASNLARGCAACRAAFVGGVATRATAAASTIASEDAVPVPGLLLVPPVVEIDRTVEESDAEDAGAPGDDLRGGAAGSGDAWSWGETTTFKHACGSCGHVVAEHWYRAGGDARRQTYAMDCALCGSGQSEHPVDPDAYESHVPGARDSSAAAAGGGGSGDAAAGGEPRWTPVADSAAQKASVAAADALSTALLSPAVAGEGGLAGGGDGGASEGEAWSDSD